MNSESIHVFATWKVKHGQLDAVLVLLTDVAEESRKEQGNVFYTIYHCTDDSNTLVLHECYHDEAALRMHRETGHFKGIVLERIVPMLETRQVVITKPL